MFFFSRSNQSWWIFWIVNSFRSHVKKIRINHKFSFWFSKSSQKFRSKKENISSYFVFAIYHFDIRYLMLVWFVVESQIFFIVFMSIWMRDIKTFIKANLHWFMFLYLSFRLVIYRFDIRYFRLVCFLIKSQIFFIIFMSTCMRNIITNALIWFRRFWFFNFLFFNSIIAFALFTVRIYVTWKTESCQKHLQRLLLDFIELKK